MTTSPRRLRAWLDDQPAGGRRPADRDARNLLARPSRPADPGASSGRPAERRSRTRLPQGRAGLHRGRRRAYRARRAGRSSAPERPAPGQRRSGVRLRRCAARRRARRQACESLSTCRRRRWLAAKARLRRALSSVNSLEIGTMGEAVGDSASFRFGWRSVEARTPSGRRRQSSPVAIGAFDRSRLTVESTRSAATEAAPPAGRRGEGGRSASRRQGRPRCRHRPPGAIAVPEPPQAGSSATERAPALEIPPHSPT